MKFSMICGWLLLSLVSAKAFASNYAALSYSESSGDYAVGTSDVGFNEAYTDALTTCGESDCFIRVAVKDGCLAMARDAATWAIVGFSGKTTLQQAEDEAMLFCHRPWQNECNIEFSMCTKTFIKE